MRWRKSLDRSYFNPSCSEEIAFKNILIKLTAQQFCEVLLYLLLYIATLVSANFGEQRSLHQSKEGVSNQLWHIGILLAVFTSYIILKVVRWFPLCPIWAQYKFVQVKFLLAKLTAFRLSVLVSNLNWFIFVFCVQPTATI